jgi:hypothetical protein
MRDIFTTVLGHDTEPLVIIEVPSQIGSSLPDLRAYWEKGYFLAGFCGYANGACLAQCQPSAKAVFVMAEAAPLFAKFVCERIRAQRGAINQDFERGTQKWIH